MTNPIPLSVLDLATVSSGSDTVAALHTTTEVARTAERLGYRRLWVAEHHAMPGIASSSPAVLLAHVAANTSNIRLGSGGVMLPNHPPLVVAEQFGTLEALHPGRIDLGLGRAPGTNQATARALRRDADPAAENFDTQVAELTAFLDGSHADVSQVHAVPKTASPPPIWLLGSSGYSARLAGEKGLPFAFAHHFSARNTLPALALYRESFQPSETLDRPYALVAAGAFAADTITEAERLVDTGALAMLQVRSGRPDVMPTPDEAQRYPYSPAEREFVRAWKANVVYGDPGGVQSGLNELIERTGADELMVVSNVHGHEPRLRSYELIAEAMNVS